MIIRTLRTICALGLALAADSREIRLTIAPSHATTLPWVGVTHTLVVPETNRRWLAGLPNIAERWAAATEARGIPAEAAVRAFMQAIRERGARPLRAWDEAG